MSETIDIIKARMKAINEVANMLEAETITFPEYMKNCYHALFYWYHGDEMSRHKRLMHKHEKWLNEQAEIYKFREELNSQ